MRVKQVTMKNTTDNKVSQNEERINRYLFGQMSTEEEMAFENDVRKDILLKKQAEASARMVKAMAAVGGKRDKELISGLKNTSANRKPFFRWVSIAASFALVLTVGYQVYEYNRMGALGAKYAMAFPVSEIIRGEEDENVVQTLTELFDNVDNGENLEFTISELSELWTLSQSDTYNEYTTYAPYIGWNLAVAHLRNNDKKEARTSLEQMQTMYPEGSAIGDKVAELLKKV